MFELVPYSLEGPSLHWQVSGYIKPTSCSSAPVSLNTWKIKTFSTFMDYNCLLLCARDILWVEHEFNEKVTKLAIFGQFTHLPGLPAYVARNLSFWNDRLTLASVCKQASRDPWWHIWPNMDPRCCVNIPEGDLSFVMGAAAGEYHRVCWVCVAVGQYLLVPLIVIDMELHCWIKWFMLDLYLIKNFFECFYALIRYFFVDWVTWNLLI